MAGYDDGDRVGPVGDPHRPRRPRTRPESGSDLAVRGSCSIRDPRELRPDPLLELSTPSCQRQVERLQLPGEIRAKLPLRLRQHRLRRDAGCHLDRLV